MVERRLEELHLCIFDQRNSPGISDRHPLQRGRKHLGWERMGNLGAITGNGITRNLGSTGRKKIKEEN